LVDMRRLEAGARSVLLSMIGIGTTFVSVRAGGGVAASSGTFSRGACVTLPTIPC
jgi:hypothetical protein